MRACSLGLQLVERRTDLADRARNRRAQGKNELNELEILSSREREVLQLIAEGNSTKEIAHVLKVSGKTIETHRSQLMERLNIHDVPGLVRYAIRIGLVESGR